jgi:8-oxo-dGTP diphosphatase
MMAQMGVTQGVIAVDIACFTVREGEVAVVLGRRTEPPFAGTWALPGGMIGQEETAATAARRVLRLRAGIDVSYLEQLFTFTEPNRDPRGRTISIAHFALIPEEQARVVQPGMGVAEVGWHRFAELPPLAFDHTRIARYARERLRQKASYAPILFRLLPPQFTMPNLYQISRAVEGGPSGPPHLSNFTAFMRARWALEAVGDQPAPTGQPGRRAKLYRYVGAPEITGPPPGEDI